MGWAVGWDTNWRRDIGYGVPAYCDQPECTEEIDRGLAYVCGGEPYGGDLGCGLYFCENHLRTSTEMPYFPQLCTQCLCDEPPYSAKQDHPKWLEHKLTDESWEPWRNENPDSTEALRILLQEQQS